MTETISPTTALSGDPRTDAIARLKHKQALLSAVGAYVLANIAVWLVWAFTGPNSGFPWPLWITGFGALGLIGQAWGIYGQRPISESDIQREMSKGS